MKILFKTTLIIFVTLGQIASGQTTNSNQGVKIRIKNESKFMITQLTILDLHFANIKSGDSTDYVNVKPFYPSMKVDITIQRERTFRRDLWYHTISYPIDHVGEKLITNDKNTLMINILNGEERGQIEMDIKIIKD